MRSRRASIGNRISIHALRVEGDIMPKYNMLYKQEISIHALRVEGDLFNLNVWCEYKISIHALRVEGDTLCPYTAVHRHKFLSTPSGWRATRTLTIE